MFGASLLIKNIAARLGLESVVGAGLDFTGLNLRECGFKIIDLICVPE